MMFNHPTAVVAASKFLYHAVTVQRLLSSTYFKVFTSQDILGVQLGGALKNPLAIGAGIIEGLELGELVNHYTPIYHHPTQAPPNKMICSSIKCYFAITTTAVDFTSNATSDVDVINIDCYAWSWSFDNMYYE
jgi:hypothetical protein